MKNSSILLAAALFISGAGAPAFSQDFHGRVIKENTRLARPQEPELHFKMDLSSQGAAPLAAKVSDDGFVLKTQKLDAETSLDGWDPYSELTARRDSVPHTSLISGAPSYSANPAAVDYNAIERAYASTASRYPLRLAGSTSHSGNGYGGNPYINSSPWAMQAAAVNMLGANGTLLQQAGQPSVDVDNCRCNMAIPTTQCIQGRMQGFGTNVYSNPQVAMPGTGFRVSAPMMSRGRSR